jgi:hypothetical protein
MAVKKKVNVSMDSFIDKGADVKANKERGFKYISLRIPSDILSEVDEVVSRKQWNDRTKWIIEAIYEKLRDCCG